MGVGAGGELTCSEEEAVGTGYAGAVYTSGATRDCVEAATYELDVVATNVLEGSAVASDVAETDSDDKTDSVGRTEADDVAETDSDDKTDSVGRTEADDVAETDSEDKTDSVGRTKAESVADVANSVEDAEDWSKVAEGVAGNVASTEDLEVASSETDDDADEGADEGTEDSDVSEEVELDSGIRTSTEVSLETDDTETKSRDFNDLSPASHFSISGYLSIRSLILTAISLLIFF